MTEDAKKQAADKAAGEKGQAKDEQIPDPNSEKTTSAGETTSETDTKANNDTKTESIETGDAAKEESSENSDTADKLDNVDESNKDTGSEKVTGANEERDDSKTSAAEEAQKEANDESTAEADSEQTNVTTHDCACEHKIEQHNTSDSASTSQADKDSDTEKLTSAEFQAEIRDQIENCKFEIIATLQENVHSELKNIMRDQLRKNERRRKIGVVVRDLIILILAILVGYFSYQLYNYGYFDFLHLPCRQTESCPAEEQQPSENPPEQAPEEIKDFEWYRQNYGDLFANLQTHPDAEKVTSYYLYSDDYKVSEIDPQYLLAMAYNQLENPLNYATGASVNIPAEHLREAFVNTFGTAEYFVKQDFNYDCYHFSYDKASDTFSTPNLTCSTKPSRKILEEIADIYEEGDVLYFRTIAAIYDNGENAYYTFDNLFKPAVTNVGENDLMKNQALLNQYQYQFKRHDEQYFLSSITKLK